MATIPQVKPKKAQIIDEAAAKIARLIEEHFDEQGWSEEERNRRVASAGARIDAAVARARSSKSG
jgi:F0F1-type ATP synthase membrane subunit b/b'